MKDNNNNKEKCKVIPIKKKVLVWCPRCGWGGFYEETDVYWCDKCTALFVLEDQ